MWIKYLRISLQTKIVGWEVWCSLCSKLWQCYAMYVVLVYVWIIGQCSLKVFSGRMPIILWTGQRLSLLPAEYAQSSNHSVFCMCASSGSPHNVMHSSKSSWMWREFSASDWCSYCSCLPSVAAVGVPLLCSLVHRASPQLLSFTKVVVWAW